MVAGFPRFLMTFDHLHALIQILLEKEKLRRSIRSNRFGSPVAGQEEAQALLEKISICAREVLPSDMDYESLPTVVLTHELSRLTRQTRRACLYVFPVSFFFTILGMSLELPSTPMFVMIGASLCLLAIPFLVHRRTRIYLEHHRAYGNNHRGEPVILMEQLPTIRFQSYLAHEYAHHLHALRNDQASEIWQREGWARLVQWQIAEGLSRQEANPAYLYHALAQITGELKFACEMIASALHVGLPREVKRIWTIYHTNPLFTLVTGTPMSAGPILVHHAMGTASYFLAADRHGLEAALHQSPETLF